MPRDNKFSVEYFDKWILFIQERNINRDIIRLPTLATDEGRAMCGDDLVRNSVQLLVMRYGRGDALKDLKSSVYQAVAMLELRANSLVRLSLSPELQKMYGRLDLGKYYDEITLLAFLLALRMPQDLAKAAVRLIGHCGEDALLDQVASFIDPTDLAKAKAPLFPKIYGPLHLVMQAAPEQRPALLKVFLNEWYRRMKPIYWHNSHLEGDGAYFGYWAFEIALAAMVLNIDDTDLNSQPNYPSDLVQYYRSQVQNC